MNQHEELNAKLQGDPTLGPRLVKALHEAVQDCACSPSQRASGHHVDCRAPEWKELLREVGEVE